MRGEARVIEGASIEVVMRETGRRARGAARALALSPHETKTAALKAVAVEIRRRDDLAMIAVQGPQARELTATCLPREMADSALELAPFHATECGGWFIARTGYTGEDGFEILLPADHAVDLWSVLLDAGVRPCGLGARDTLRLEAGMNLYGQDMGEDVGPLESGLEWTVAWEPAERDFIGRASLTSPTMRSTASATTRSCRPMHWRCSTTGSTASTTAVRSTTRPTVRWPTWWCASPCPSVC